ncbi:hypothetical protein KAR91_03345 [Candidatus Pacearchaeota archaeon]|nr:hypothetical protein [Candidatus Pacearchaeota archaeon]
MQVYVNQKDSTVTVIFLGKCYTHTILFDQDPIDLVNELLDNIDEINEMKQFGTELANATLLLHDKYGKSLPIVTNNDCENIINLNEETE